MTNYYSNKQKIIMNNHNEIVKKNSNVNSNTNDYINKNIYMSYSNSDFIEIERLYKSIENPYQKKIDLINLILKSNIQLNIITLNDLKKFFDWLAPLNNEYNMSSYSWRKKIIESNGEKRLLIQNAISKSDIGTFLYKNYINLIKKKLTDSKLNYYYFELKNKRFNKIKDIIFAIDIDLLDRSNS